MLHPAVIVNDSSRGVVNRKGIVRGVSEGRVQVDIGGEVFSTAEANIQPTDEQIEVELITPYDGAPYYEVVIPTTPEDWGDLMDAPESNEE